MASVPVSDHASANVPQTPSASTLLVSLSPLTPEALSATLANLAAAFPDQPVLVATPDPEPPTPPTAAHLNLITHTPATAAPAAWVLTAADYLNTFKLMQEHQSPACLLLGPEAQSLAPEALRALAEAVLTRGCDLTMPHYTLGPRDGLVNSAILYPVTRALFATRPRFPLAIDLAFTARMAQRLAACAQKHAASQSTAIVWPVAEAATAGFSLTEVPAGTRALPPPNAIDLNAMLAQVAGSFFADLDAKASFWQRARLAYPPRPAPPQPESSRRTTPTDTPADPPDVQSMLDSFHLAYTNLQEIWSLVLPPNSLLGLKKLSLLPPAAFRMPDALWVRIIYDFVLAYRLRTLNRGHLLGALTPLYLAWAASHLLLTSGAAADSVAPEIHVEALAAAFEADKPYLVSRWRWPDRFNP
jgi:hypothetical protein